MVAFLLHDAGAYVHSRFFDPGWVDVRWYLSGFFVGPAPWLYGGRRCGPGRSHELFFMVVLRCFMRVNPDTVMLFPHAKTRRNKGPDYTLASSREILVKTRLASRNAPHIFTVCRARPFPSYIVAWGRS